MYSEESKAIIVCFIFFLLAIAMTEYYVREYSSPTYAVIDGENHFENKPYLPLYEWISTPFKYNSKTFYLFSLFLISFVIPLLAFLALGKKWEIVLFYFIATNIFWFTDTLGSIPSILSFALVFAYSLTKKGYPKLAIFALSFLLHSIAFYLIAVFALIELFTEKKTFLLAVCPIAPKISRVVHGEKVVETLQTIRWKIGASLPDILITFTKFFPLPLAIIAALKAEKKWLYFSTAILAAGMLWQYTEGQRILIFYGLPLLGGLATSFRNYKIKGKTLILAISLTVFAVNFSYWLQYKAFHLCTT